MKKNLIALLLSLMILISVVVPATADFGRAGNMVSPAVLELIPEDSLTNRFWVVSSRYTWSYAPLFFRPEERISSENEGPAATDPEVSSSAIRVKLPRTSGFTVVWESGWAPDKVSVTAWKADVFNHPDSTEEYLLGAKELQNEKIDLEPNCVYQFHAVWELDAPDDEVGEADYYFVTEQMTAAEAAAAEARLGAPFSEADLKLLTLKIEDVDCTVGITTPEDLMKAGIYCDYENDGTITLTTSEDPYGYIYTQTADGTMNSPIISVNAFWGYEIRLEYCGLVWHAEDENPDDNPENDDWDDDEDWDEDDLADENTLWGIWAAFADLTNTPFFVEESPEGIASTVITLSNGRELSVSDHDSPVSLYLLPEKGTEYKDLSEAL